MKAVGDNKSAPFSRELHSLYTKSTLIGEGMNLKKNLAELGMLYIMLAVKILMSNGRNECILAISIAMTYQIIPLK